jgi:citrate lyase beta subunit
MLDDQAYARIDAHLAAADRYLADRYRGDRGDRQPVHTVYVPADQFTSALPAQWGAAAITAIEANLGDADALAAMLDIDAAIAAEVFELIRAKLTREPIEDLRIDFEDGFGVRSDAEEDAVAIRAGRELAELWAGGAARPPFAGIRFKSLEPTTRRRGIRTIELVVDAVLAGDATLETFVLTLPKVTHVDQVSAFALVCDALEADRSLAPGTLRFEIQIETPQSVLAGDGTAAVARMITAGSGRVSGLHYGTYDYSAACGISAAYQSLEHPAADHAKAVMQLAAAGTGVRLSDGSTNVLPIGSPAAIATAWRLHARLVRRSLERGYYQGWDLHPLQLVTRYAANYAFYRSGMPAAADRLRRYLDNSSEGVLDEPATAQALATLLVRGQHCGAIDAREIPERFGVGADVLDRLYRRRVG